MACRDDSEVQMNEPSPVDPQITNVNISKDTLKQGTFRGDDFFYFNFTYTNQFGDPGFASASDIINLTFIDLRLPNGVPLIFNVSSASDANVLVEGENIRVNVPTTCCVIAGNNPCTPFDNTFEEIAYEVLYTNNIGFDIPRDTIQFVVNCSF